VLDGDRWSVRQPRAEKKTFRLSHEQRILTQLTNRVVFVIQTSEGDTKSGGSGNGSPPVHGSRGEAPVGGLGTKSPEAEAFY